MMMHHMPRAFFAHEILASSASVRRAGGVALSAASFDVLTPLAETHSHKRVKRACSPPILAMYPHPPLYV